MLPTFQIMRTRGGVDAREDAASGSQVFVIEESLSYLLNHAAPHNVTLGQWAVLMSLWVEDGVSQTELSRQVAIEDAMMVRAIARVERDGLVQRQRSPHVHRCRNRSGVRSLAPDDCDAVGHTCAARASNCAGSERTGRIGVVGHRYGRRSGGARSCIEGGLPPESRFRQTRLVASVGAYAGGGAGVATVMVPGCLGSANPCRAGPANGAAPWRGGRRTDAR